VNLAIAFGKSASAHAQKPAVYWGETEFNFEQLHAQALAVGAHLIRELKVRRGDRVGLWLKNCPEYITAFFGILQADAILVPINNFLKPDEAANIVSDAGIKVLVTDRSMHDASDALKRPELTCINVEDFPKGTVSSSTSMALENDVAVLIYTSGTTGRAKGTMLTHRNLLSNVESCRQVLMAVDADRFVVVLPLFHSFMMTVGMLLPLLVGGSVVLVKSVHPPKNIIMEILHRQGTLLPAVPQFFRLLAHAQLPKDLPLRLCISGGAPLPVEILREFNERVPIPLIEGYGLSEASPVVSLNPIKGPWKTGSIGKPVPGVEVTVQSDEGKILGANETGDICVRGPNVMAGYWNHPDETAKAMRDGWLLTGDVGYRDAEGYFFITDRKKDMLLVNGINVYPREIEELIYQYPGVKEAAVVGIPDSRKGEQPLAFIAPSEGAQVDEKSLIQFLRGKLAEYKVPKRVVSMPALPRNATGKIVKRMLKEQARGLVGAG